MTIQNVIDVLKIEAEGILALAERVDEKFVNIVDCIANSRGRLIIAGIGKSGLVGRKIAATLNSTGTRTLFLHPVEAMHGDIGIVGKRDIVLALSNSGETEELINLIPSLKQIGCYIISFTGNTQSLLAKLSDITIDVGVEREACPLGLAPTTSTTALMAIGDALAVALIHKKKFKPSDFKRNHPGGTLGQRLSLKVSELMLTDSHIPLLSQDASIQDALNKLDSLRLGAVFIVDANNILLGIITDGDIRHFITANKNIQRFHIEDLMTKSPLSVRPGSAVYDALNLMEQYQITVLPVTYETEEVIGLLHLHDILGKGAFTFSGQTNA